MVTLEKNVAARVTIGRILDCLEGQEGQDESGSVLIKRPSWWETALMQVVWSTPLFIPKGSYNTAEQQGLLFFLNGSNLFEVEEDDLGLRISLKTEE